MPCINVGKPKSPTYFPVEVIKPTTNYWKYSILWKSIEMKCSFFFPFSFAAMHNGLVAAIH
jgi:hypothetical protein